LNDKISKFWNHSVGQRVTVVNLLSDLSKHLLDICFVWPTRDDQPSPHITFQPLDKDELQLVAAEDHILMRKARLELVDLKRHTLFLMPWQTRTVFYAALVDACREVGFESEPRTDIIQMPFVMSVIATGQGITFIPSFLNRVRPTGIKFRPFNFLPRASRAMPLCIAYGSHAPSLLVQNFVKVALHMR
jgi:DNA-binding transcriptional LysR family regulator